MWVGLTLAQGFQGIVQFMEEFGWMALRLMVLDDEAGPVGSGVLSLVGQPSGVASNNSSLVETW